MDVSIVIRTRNEGKSIEETLERLEGQEFSGKYEIIVVDSESTDSTVNIVKRYNVKLIEIAQKEFTYGRSLNIGANEAQGEFIVNLSAHASPRDKKWLTNLIAGFEEDNVAGIYGRQLSVGRLNPFEALKNDQLFGQERIKFNVKNKKILKQLHFSNSNCAVRKDVWETFRFNEQVAWAEDLLWQKEVIEAGFSIVYAPDAGVYHTHGVNIYGAYNISRDCAFTLALMDRKRQSIPMILYDIGVFLALIPNSIFENLRYVWRNNYHDHLKVAPLYVMCAWFGWLVGRMKYRLRRQ